MYRGIEMHNNNNNSSRSRSISIPNFFYITDNAMEKVDAILSKEDIQLDRSLIVSGTGYTCKVADYIAERISCSTTNSSSRVCIKANDINAIRSIGEAIVRSDASVVIAVGGGKVLDTTKYACSNLNRPMVAFPTALSNDGISSPIAVVRLDEIESVGAKPPLGIVIDIDVVKHSPRHTILAGVGDLISNLSAVEDWRLAHEHKGDEIDRFAEIISRNAAERFMYYVLKNGKSVMGYDGEEGKKKEEEYKHYSSHDDSNSSSSNTIIHDDKFLVCLAEGLIQSGIAMSIAGTSRPASGAEHLISHALDRILDQPKPHGIQVGFATLFTMALRGSEIQDILRVYRILGFPTTFDAIGISLEQFMEAVRLAPYTRKNRFTILDMISRDDVTSIIKAIRLAYNTK